MYFGPARVNGPGKIQPAAMAVWEGLQVRYRRRNLFLISLILLGILTGVAVAFLGIWLGDLGLW